MKKVEFPLFGENEYMFLNIGRLIDIERMTGKPAGEIIKNQSLDLGMLTIILSVALRHHKMRTPQWYANKLQDLVDEGIDLETDIQIPVVKCIAGSGILGKAIYYKLFPEEMTENSKEELETERKN
nr:MAG TPA: tail assembly chaperone protein [Caudoviricetes sp.]